MDLKKIVVRGTNQNDAEALRPKFAHLNRPTHPIETQVLLQAGLEGMQRFSGFIPKKLDAQPVIRASEDLTEICDGQVIHLIPTLLSRKYHNLLIILVEKLYFSGQRIPDEWLPTIMDLGDNRFQNVVSERGRWLAKTSQNPRWQWVRANEDIRFTNKPDWRLLDNVWNKLFWFQRLRQEQPAVAIRQLIENWDDLETEYKSEYLYKLSFHLSMRDEPFLWEQYCRAEGDENLVSISYAAAHLLSHLIASRFVKQVVPELMTYFYFDKGTFPKHNSICWDVEKVHQYEKKYQSLNLSDSKQTKDRYFLSDLFSFIPLSHWYKHFGFRAEDFVKIAAREANEPNIILLRTWQQRAVIDGDPLMAYAMINHWVKRHKSTTVTDYTGRYENWIFEHPTLSISMTYQYWSNLTENVKSLFNLLPWEQFIELLYQLLDIADAKHRKT